MAWPCPRWCGRLRRLFVLRFVLFRTLGNCYRATKTKITLLLLCWPTVCAVYPGLRLAYWSNLAYRQAYIGYNHAPAATMSNNLFSRQILSWTRSLQWQDSSLVWVSGYCAVVENGNGERMPWGYVSRPACTECRAVVVVVDSCMLNWSWIWISRAFRRYETSL